MSIAGPTRLVAGSSSPKKLCLSGPKKRRIYLRTDRFWNGQAGQPVKQPHRKPSFISPSNTISFHCAHMYTGRAVSGSSQVLSHVINLKSIWVSYRAVERPVQDVQTKNRRKTKNNLDRLLMGQEYRQTIEIPSMTVNRPRNLSLLRIYCASGNILRRAFLNLAEQTGLLYPLS